MPGFGEVQTEGGFIACQRQVGRTAAKVVYTTRSYYNSARNKFTRTHGDTGTQHIDVRHFGRQASVEAGNQ